MIKPYTLLRKQYDVSGYSEEFKSDYQDGQVAPKRKKYCIFHLPVYLCPVGCVISLKGQHILL
jgi:hypothetical protein